VPLNVYISSHHRGEQSTDYFVCRLTAAEVTQGGPNETGGCDTMYRPTICIIVMVLGFFGGWKGRGVCPTDREM